MGIQGISALVLGRGPLAKVGSSANFCVVVFQGISALVLGRRPLAKVGSFYHLLSSGMQVISALVLGVGGPLAKVGSSSKFCVVVCRSSLLWYWGVHWPE